MMRFCLLLFFSVTRLYASEANVSLDKTKPVGQATYDRHCVVCHQEGVAGAPKFRVSAEWNPRLEAKKLDGLVASAIEGLNAMPPKGTCVDCSQDDLKNAIQYMLPKS